MACWRCAIFPPMSDEIEKLRREVDALDDQLAALLNRRADLAQRIGAVKSGAPAYRPERETEILRRVTQANAGPLSAERLAAVFREVISACRGLEEAIRVSYLGPEGTFSEQAVRKHFGRAVKGQPSGSVDDAFRRCESGAVQFAVVPVENSTEGVVGRTLDLLLATPLRICAEIELRVQQNLLCKGESLRAVRRVYSHAQSLAQCNGWLAQNMPGAVHALLTPLAQNRVSMSRIESRPSRAGAALWEYMFFVDIEGHQKDPSVAAALAELRAKAPYLKILGSYPSAC